MFQQMQHCDGLKHIVPWNGLVKSVKRNIFPAMYRYIT